MWIFFNDAFLSVVAHKTLPDSLLVRARADNDIEAVFPHAIVSHTPDHDYAYRTILSRNEVAEAIWDRALQIDYPNFKGSIRQEDRNDIYFDVWRDMFEFQRRREGP